MLIQMVLKLQHEKLLFDVLIWYGSASIFALCCLFV
jgi:hypothetical protein